MSAAARSQAKAMTSRPILYLIDGHSYAYRAFYGLPPLSNRKGQATQAVYGFAMFLLKLLREKKAEFVTVAFDSPGPTFRHREFEVYKAQRKPMPDDLVSQLPLIQELVDNLGVPQFRREGFEADDIIATLTARAVKAGQNVVIYSGDKDILQLVGPHVRVVVPRKEEEEMDPKAVIRKWGVPPEKMVELLALMGDSSDNLPGAPGIGEKTAVSLLARFPTVDDLYARIAEAGSPKLREKLLRARELVYKTRDLAVLRTDVPIPGGVEATKRRPHDGEKVRALFTELEFNRLMDGLPSSGAAARKPGMIPERAARADAEMAGALRKAERVWLVRSGEGETAALALSCGTRRWLLPWEAEAVAALREALGAESPRKIVDDTKALAGLLPGMKGVELDAVLAAYLIEGRGGRSSLTDIAEECLSVSFAPDDAASEEERAALALDALEAAAPVLEKRLEEAGAGKLLREIEMPVAPVLAEMEARGIRLDARVLDLVREEIEGRLGDLEREITEAAGGPFNILSPKQVGEVLFSRLQLPAKKKTKTGFSTDEAVLDDLSARHPVPAKILDYRKLAKLLGTYLDPLPAMCDAEGLLHTTFHQTGAATGRLSSSNPNMQNIPIRGDIGQRIRSAFVPRSKEWLLLSCDYSQIELRILAHVTRDRLFLEAFRHEADVHAATAAEMFGIPPAKVSPDQRRAAKAVNFGIVYGMTAFGLSRELKCPPGTAQDYLDRYFERHGAVREYWDSTLKHVRERGYAVTLFGRRRYLPEIAAQNKTRREEAEREALNHPIQGTAADMMKLAIARVAERVPEARLLLTIHDELLFEVPRGSEEKLGARVREVMEGVCELAAPLKAEAAWGRSWAECHP